MIFLKPSEIVSRSTNPTPGILEGDNKGNSGDKTFEKIIADKIIVLIKDIFH